MLEKNEKLKCKASTTPNIGRGFYTALEDLQIDQAIIVAPVADKYPLKKGVFVMPLNNAINELFS